MRGRLHPPWPCDREQIPASPRASVFLIWRMGLQPRPTSAHLWGATFHVNLTCVPSKRVIVNKSRQHLKGRELQFVTKCVRMAHFRPQCRALVCRSVCRASASLLSGGAG